MKKLSAFMAAVMLLAVFAFTTPSDASFTQKEETDLSVDKGTIGSRLPFEDVSVNDWFYSATEFTYQHGLVNGTAENSFSPAMTMTRGMFVTLLGRLEEADVTAFSNSRFSDVDNGKYYAPYIEWGADAGIVSGYGDGIFAPDDPMTREQLALILKNFCDYKGIVTKNTGISLDGYDDAAEIHDWAYEAVAWAVENSVISGISATQLAPRMNSNRSQTAQLIYNYLTNIRYSPATAFTVSRAFSNDMVLQRGEDIKIWGFAPEAQTGKTVTAEFRENGEIISSETAVIADGEWELILNRHLSVFDSDSCTLRVYGKGIEYNYERVLVGDVYMIIGQSNVNYSLYTQLQNDSSLRSALAADSSWTGLNVRFLRNSATDWTGEIPQGSAEMKVDLSSTRGWTTPDENFNPVSADFISDIITPTSNLGSFSAIGALSALDLCVNTEIPIGMVEVDAAGCQLSAFMPNSLCERFDCDVETIGAYNMPVFADRTIMLSSRWIYNQMIYPLQRLSLSGLLWYQGESDLLNTTVSRGDNPSYIDEFTALIEYLRGNFTNHDIPVFAVELPTIYNRPEGYAGEWHFMDFGNIRTDMGYLANTVDDMYFAASSDVWLDRSYFNNLHPYCKPAQTERLLSLIYARMYSADAENALEYSAGAQVDSVSYSGNTAVLTYRYTADGLQAFCEEIDGRLNGFDVYVKDPESGNKLWIGQCGYGDTGESLDCKISSDNTVTLSLNGLEILGVRYNARYDAMFGTGVTLCSVSDEGKYIPAIAYCEYK